MELVFKALADSNRRIILDHLFSRNGQTLGQLCELSDISRQGTSKHIRILEEANLITIHWQGREKLHFLNPVPIAEMVARWVGKFEDARLEALTDIKSKAESLEKYHVR